MRAVAGAAAGLVLLFSLTVAGVVAHAYWLAHVAGPPEPAEAIIVLGGGVTPDGAPGPDSRLRLRHGIALYEAGLAPRIHFTGGNGNLDLPPLGEQMQVAAVDAGVPPGAVSTESASSSTAQNALFSLPKLPPDTSRPAILVSDGYHLARAWATFRWAGYGPLELSAATAFGLGGAGEKARRVGREALAVWFNAVRLPLWSLLDAVGLGTQSIDLLADGRANAATSA